MPVQSKIYAGREKKPPPVPGPRPILKHRSAPKPWVSPENQTHSHQENGYAEGNAPPSPLFRLSVIRQPIANGLPSPTTPNGVPEEHGERVDFRSIGDPAGDVVDTLHRTDGKVKQINSNHEDGDVNVPEMNTETAVPKYNRSTSRFSISGLQALKECEDHTDWANEVLKRNNLPLISDLRKSIGDGFTLPTILEIISGRTLHCIKSSPKTKEDRTENLRICLKFLCKQGADISGIHPADIEDGHLKTSLLLVGNIRKHFSKSYKPGENGHSHHVGSSTSSDPSTPTLPQRNMPGAVKLPGAIPTPFQVRDLPQGNRNSQPGSPTRKGYQQEELIPGVLGNKTNSAQPTKPHSALISTTELGTNGVAQHGVEERRQHLSTNNQNSSRSILLRHPNAKTGPPVIPKSPMPQGPSRAWTASPRQHGQNTTNHSGRTSVQDRLSQLINGNHDNKNNSNGTPVARENQGYNGDGMFHGGGSEVFDVDDGEMFVVPPPKSRNSPDFELMMLGDHSYGPGYRHSSNQPRGQRTQGYVPSKPAEKWQGSRAEALLDRQPKPSPMLPRTSRQTPMSQTVPGMTSGAGHDNYAFNHDSRSSYGNRGGHSQDMTTVNGKAPGPAKGDNSDLRNACNKLYGQNSQPPPYGVSNQPLTRGENLRSSYGPQTQTRGPQNSGQYSVKFAPSQSVAYRPVSAPAPAHMQAFFDNQDRLQGHSQSQENLDNQGQVTINTSSQRESPMGQSSSTQGHLEESSSSQQSGNSQGQGQVLGHLPLKSAFDSYGKSSFSQPSSLSPNSPKSPSSPNYAIGPASKYPEMGSRPSSARKPPQGPFTPGSPAQRHEMHINDQSKVSQMTDNLQKHDFSKPPLNRGHNISFTDQNAKTSTTVNQKQTKFSDTLTTALQAASRVHHSRGFSYDNSLNTSHDRTHDRSHDRSHDRHFMESEDIQDHSIFDYDEISHSETSGSVTPPLPPLSPTNTPPDSPLSDLSPQLPRSHSATNVSSAVKDPLEVNNNHIDKQKPRRTSELQFRMERKTRSKRNYKRGLKTRGLGLNDVKESVSNTESDLSFDIDDTILTVESHDTEQLHPAGDILTSHEASALRQQLHELQSKYQNLQAKVVSDKHQGHMHLHPVHGKGHPHGPGPPPIGRQRRWSIGSSDTSSFRRESKYKPGKQIQHRHQSKEFKNINKRFQRLESHVVTLARSVAHLSSELRTHNTMVNDLEGVKKELRELKDNPSHPFPQVLGSQMTEYERFRGWVPSLTNPKRVNKLTKFFGAEPPLLKLFLEKLGYEKYVSNFQSEHIGMIELPYMTEERLEKIGVPMGPRLRILQEAQMCFRHENFNIYLV